MKIKIQFNSEANLSFLSEQVAAGFMMFFTCKKKIYFCSRDLLQPPRALLSYRSFLSSLGIRGAKFMSVCNFSAQ